MRNTIILATILTLSFNYSNAQIFKSNSLCNCSEDAGRLGFGSLAADAQSNFMDSLQDLIQTAQETINNGTKKDTIYFGGDFVLTKQGKRNIKLREQIKLWVSQIFLIEKSFIGNFKMFDFYDSQIDSSEVYIEGPVTEKFSKLISFAGHYKNELFIQVNYHPASIDAFDFSVLHPRFIVKRKNGTQVRSEYFLIFSDANNDQLFALPMQSWWDIAMAAGERTVLGVEIQTTEVEEYNNSRASRYRISTELEFYILKNKEATLRRYKEKTKNSDNIKLIFKEYDLDFNHMGKTDNVDISFYTSNDTAVNVWFNANNKYNIASFLSKYVTPDVINSKGGFNYNLNVDSFPDELFSVDYWLTKIKLDKLLQDNIGTTRIYNSKYVTDLASTPMFTITSSKKDINLKALGSFNKEILFPPCLSGRVSNDMKFNPEYHSLWYSGGANFPKFFSLEKEGVEKKIAFAIQNLMAKYALEYDRIKAKAKESKEAETKNEEFKQTLIKKFGAKYTEAALKGDIIVGMPDALIKIPLRIWTIDSNEQWNKGYRLYCHSKLNTAIKLWVTVQNGKVSSVSAW